MKNYNKIMPGDIVALRDMQSKKVGNIKISKTTEKIVYRPSTSFGEPNIEIEYITEEKTGRFNNITIVSEVSAMGKSLLGEKVGNTVVVNFPTGKIRKYYIMDVKSFR